MPYQSKAQAKKFRVLEARHEIPAGTASRWARHTPDLAALPEHVKKQKDHAKRAFAADFVLKCAAAGVTAAADVARAAEAFAAELERLAAPATKSATVGEVLGNVAGKAMFLPVLGSVVAPLTAGYLGGRLGAGAKNQTESDDAETLRTQALANAYRRRAALAKSHAEVRKLVADDPSKYVVLN